MFGGGRPHLLSLTEAETGELGLARSRDGRQTSPRKEEDRRVECSLTLTQDVDACFSADDGLPTGSNLTLILAVIFNLYIGNLEIEVACRERGGREEISGEGGENAMFGGIDWGHNDIYVKGHSRPLKSW